MTVDPDAATPVYRQVAAIIRAAIESGEIPPGRAVPSEKTLMQEHGIARETARKAVRVLRDEGLVEIVQGRGAYVVGRP
ncbi:MAG: GntR family transcriptional regulator [Streptosporangiaceae bacterium]